jgi:hypothetical protein
MYYYILFIILIAILIFHNKNEEFKDVCDLHPTGIYKTTCPKNSLYPNKICDHCPWKRPNLDLESEEKCCKNKCNQKKCIPIGKPYYCKYQSICTKKYASNDKNKYCGFYTLYNNPAKIYNTLEECKTCENPYERLKKKECLAETNAGWCTDYRGIGLCVPGTPEGPNNMIRYNMCYPNQKSNINSWIYYNYIQ